METQAEEEAVRRYKCEESRALFWINGSAGTGNYLHLIVGQIDVITTIGKTDDRVHNCRGCRTKKDLRQLSFARRYSGRSIRK